MNTSNNLGIVVGVDAGQLHFDAVVANGSNEGLGDAKAVDTITNDFDGLGELLLALDVANVGGAGKIGRF